MAKKRYNKTKEKIKEKETVKIDSTNNVCLNCGTELKGEFCHKCGQANLQHQSKIKNFILEYLSNAFILDPKLLPTLWTLIRRPGHLTNEFMAGRYVSYEHPIKFNMFLLLVFVTIFLLFSDTERMNNTLINLTSNEKILPALAIATLESNKDYYDKIKESESDTIKLILPKDDIDYLKENITIIKVVEVLPHNKDSENDTILAKVPSVIIEDRVIVADELGTYKFIDENNFINKSMEFNLINNAWQKSINIITQYFPLIILLTAPFLSIAVGIVHRQKKRAPIKHFVFSLHYTAFVELMLILTYIIYLIAKPTSVFMEYFMLITTYAYLTLSIKTAYRNSWSRSLIKSLIISFTYLSITFVALLVILLIAIIIASSSL